MLVGTRDKIYTRRGGARLTEAIARTAVASGWCMSWLFAVITVLVHGYVAPYRHTMPPQPGSGVFQLEQGQWNGPGLTTFSIACQSSKSASHDTEGKVH